jgi:hypothetical protein
MKSGYITAFMLVLAAGSSLSLQGFSATPSAAPKPQRPPLYLREEWQQSAKGGEHPLDAGSVGNADLELSVHVPGGEILLTGAAGDETNPTHLWMGMCTTPCAAALRSKTRLADLTGLARLRWNTKMSGFHQVRPLVKLADGTWLAGDVAQGSTRDWLVNEIAFADVRWMKIDIARVVTTGLVLDKVDLSRVEEIGFADLMPGSGHGPGGWSDVAQIEVYAKAVPR